MADLYFENKCEECGRKLEENDDVHVYSRTYVDRIAKGGTMVKGNVSFPDPVVIENGLVIHCHPCWRGKHNG